MSVKEMCDAVTEGCQPGLKARRSKLFWFGSAEVAVVVVGTARVYARDDGLWLRSPTNTLSSSVKGILLDKHTHRLLHREFAVWM